jgi:dTDP-4-amino-4,6-dideoxygalactose transaminase
MSADFLSCNGLGYSPARMVWRLLPRPYPGEPDWFKFPGCESILTYQGRYAIGLLCRLLNIVPGDEVLVPSYNCGAEIEPFLWTGAQVILYRVDRRTYIDIEDLYRRITPKTKIIYITHFFGWPQPIKELSEYCKAKEIHLVEDCALSLFSSGPASRIGRMGDAAIYSFVKFLPVADGGALVLAKSTLGGNRELRPPDFRSAVRPCLPLVKKWFMHEYAFWQRFEVTRNMLVKSWLNNPADERDQTRPAMLASNHFQQERSDWSISKLSLSVLNTTDPSEIFRKRRRNYEYLHESLSAVRSFQPLFDSLPDGVCPQSFPAYVGDRRRWSGYLEASGILVGGWPGYHPGFDWDQYPEAIDLKSNLLTLPVHQNLEERHLEHIARCVRDYAERI